MPDEPDWVESPADAETDAPASEPDLLAAGLAVFFVALIGIVGILLVLPTLY